MASWRSESQSETNENDSAFFEDSSLVYVKDRHGVLYSPPGYKQCKPTPTSPDPLQEVHAASCTMKTSSTNASPCKLYQICKNFVAKNLHLVESLVDFPESVGYDIFHEAHQMRMFNRSPEYLSLFSVAYNSLVLESLSLKQSAAAINENIHILKYFDCLTQLDLAHCRLGDEHEYLKWIGKMSSLQYICLKDNCLTDTGISLWTLPHRMLKSGPGLLRTLDLSCNPHITDSGAKCLVKFLHLQALNLSGTAITITSGIRNIMKQTNLKLVSHIPDFSKEEFTTTKGWASPVISDLIAAAAASGSAKSDTSHQQPKKSFYQSTATRFTMQVEKIADEGKILLNNYSYPALLLLSEELVLPDTLRNTDSCSSPGKQTNKRRRTNGLLDSSCIKKRKVSLVRNNEIVYNDNNSRRSDVENLENDSASQLLDSYLKYL